MPAINRRPDCRPKSSPAHRSTALSALATVFLAALPATLPDGAARAQDVPGIEACDKEAKLERRTGCLQTNIAYLQGLIARNNTATQQRLAAAAAEIAALKATVASLQAAVDRLQAAAGAAKPADAKPADAKPADAKPTDAKPAGQTAPDAKPAR